MVLVRPSLSSVAILAPRWQQSADSKRQTLSSYIAMKRTFVRLCRLANQFAVPTESCLILPPSLTKMGLALYTQSNQTIAVMSLLRLTDLLRKRLKTSTKRHGAGVAAIRCTEMRRYVSVQGRLLSPRLSPTLSVGRRSLGQRNPPREPVTTGPN